MSSHLYLLTGGSRGMGLAIARQLLVPGNSVISIARHANAALLAPAGASLQQWALDLSDGTAAALRLHDWLAAQQPGHFASATLINNAGVIARLAPLGACAGSADLMALAQALRVNLEAPMQLCAAFLDATAAWQVPRKVLNISSGLGRRALASQAAYCAAKAGMDHFTRCLALEESNRPGGARVCSLAPGVIDTDMQLQLRSADANDFPSVASFARLKTGGALSSPGAAAKSVLAYLARADFGSHPVADVRDNSYS